MSQRPHYYDDTNRIPGTAPYPVDGISWDPIESLEELNKSRKAYLSASSVQYSSNVRIPGPPLPSRPPQHIIDQHTPQKNLDGYISTGNSPGRLNTTPVHRLQGPRDFPQRFSATSLSSPIASGQSPRTPDISVRPNYSGSQQYSSIVSPQYDPGAVSSPLGDRYHYQTQLSAHSTPDLVGPRPLPHSLPSTPGLNYNSPAYTRTQPEKPSLGVITGSNIPPYIERDFNVLNSPSISVLPDIPVLTPTTANSSHYETITSQRRNSTSPIRNSLYGPRLPPNSSSVRESSPSPSTSPNRNYYDHRTSWRSEYSVNIIDAEDYEDDELLSNIHEENVDPFQDDNVFEDTIPKVSHTSIPVPFFDPDSIIIPETKGVNTRIPSAAVNKKLPPVPVNQFELPSLPFTSQTLTEEQLNQCANVSLLSEVFQWSVILSQQWTDGLLLSKDEYKKSLQILFRHKNPKLKRFLIEKNVDQLMMSFEKQNSIYVDENDYIYFLDNVKVNGVLIQLTGCYSNTHKHPNAIYQCCSPRCSLTIYQPPVPMVPPQVSSTGKLGEWASYWNLSSQELKELDGNEVKKQSHIFELIRQQQNIVKLGELQVHVYGQSFKTTQPQLLPDILKFYNDAFNSVKPLIELHKKHLLEPLLNKLNTQGQYISGIGEIFLNWASLATVPYLKYTERLASVRELIKYEKARGSRFAAWLAQTDQQQVIVDASLDHSRIFFSGFIGHTQLLSLALMSVQKKTKESDEDHKLLYEAVEAVNKLNRKIDETQESALQHRSLKILARQLSWRNTVLETDLKLYESNRRIIKRGEVTKKDKWTSSTITLILLDNYLLLTEEVKEGSFKIIEKPIPIEFLQLETKDFSALKAELNTEGESYPFKIRYTGQNISHTLFTDTLSERDAWFQSFNQVKQTKGSVLETEPFKLRVLSDQFAYEEGQEPTKLPVCTPGSNIDVMLKSFQQSLEEQFDQMSLNSRPVMHSEVLSSTTVNFQNKTYHIVGLSFGLYITEADNPRGWKRVLEMYKITQVEQLDSLLILISDKALCYFSIVSLLLNHYELNQYGHIVGEKLSKRDVSFFKIGSYYNTKLVFMMKTPIQTIGSPRFKVFTPIFDSFGKFQYFQLYKKFQFGSEVYGISIFNSMFVLHTSKGFEILSFQILYESQPIPKFLESLKKPKTELDLIKKKLKSSNCKPLQMVKVLNKPQFYLVYDSFVIVIDTIGQLISDKFIFPFKFKCSKVSIKDNFIICIGEDIVEIFDLSYDDSLGFQNFDPVQILTGKDIKLIDENDAKISIAHPSISGRQLIIYFEKVKP